MVLLSFIALLHAADIDAVARAREQHCETILSWSAGPASTQYLFTHCPDTAWGKLLRPVPGWRLDPHAE